MTDTAEHLEQQISDAIRGQRQSTVTVLSCLLAVYGKLHYVPDEAIGAIARHLHVTNNEVWSTASFYTNFRFTPPGKHTVEVCWGPTCHLVGAQRVSAEVMQSLNLRNEGDTPDGRATFRYSTCLGCCAVAPAMSIDHHLIGRVAPGEATQRVAKMDGPVPERH